MKKSTDSQTDTCQKQFKIEKSHPPQYQSEVKMILNTVFVPLPIQ